MAYTNDKKDQDSRPFSAFKAAKDLSERKKQQLIAKCKSKGMDLDPKTGKCI